MGENTHETPSMGGNTFENTLGDPMEEDPVEKPPRSTPRVRLYLKNQWDLDKNTTGKPMGLLMMSSGVIITLYTAFILCFGK